MAGCVHRARTRRVMCVNLGDKVSVPSLSSMIGTFRFDKTNITAVPRDDVIEFSPDHGAVYLNIYRRVRHAVASRRRAQTQPMGERRSH